MSETTDAPAARPAARPAQPRIDRGRRDVAFLDSPLAKPVLGVAGTLGVIALMELAVRLGDVRQDTLPLPSSVLLQIATDLVTPEFWGIVGATMQGWGIGLLLACVIAIPSGLAIGSNELLWRAVRPTVEFLRPVPGVALVPLSILVFGLGLSGKVFLVTFGVTWILLVQTIYGVREVDRVARDTVRSYRLTRAERLRWLVVPSALPFIATGLRIGAAVALIICVTAELVIGSRGLGREIAFAQISGAFVTMSAVIVTTGLLGVLINACFSWLERRTLHWHVSLRGKEGL